MLLAHTDQKDCHVRLFVAITDVWRLHKFDNAV